LWLLFDNDDNYDDDDDGDDNDVADDNDEDSSSLGPWLKSVCLGA
jgi:hypothetical protein